MITGSPQPLVEAVYFDTPWLRAVNLIASQIQRGYGLGIDDALSGHEKVAQLERKIALRCGCTVAIATVIRTIRCFISVSIVGE
ncbi:HAD hydrolase YfhB [Escherichia coli]|nr:HAD hydrolase YfhB [Escherichia coli]